MAMNTAGLSAALYSALKLTPAQDPSGSIPALAQAIVTYIQSNATVTVQTTASIVSTIIAPPTGGPCAGTLSASGTGTVA